MPSFFETLEGELNWARTQTPELSPFKNKPSDPDKYQWKVMLRPNQESMMKILDLQAKGCKNKLGKDDRGYTVNFNRPTERRNTRTGAILEKFEPPKVFKSDGVTPMTDLIGNGSKGKVTVEVYEHNAPNGGKAHAARLHSITVTELVPYGDQAQQPAAQTAQGWPSNT